jgi:hypothetical protein
MASASFGTQSRPCNMPAEAHNHTANALAGSDRRLALFASLHARTLNAPIGQIWLSHAQTTSGPVSDRFFRPHELKTEDQAGGPVVHMSRTAEFRPVRDQTPTPLVPVCTTGAQSTTAPGNPVLWRRRHRRGSRRRKWRAFAGLPVSDAARNQRWRSSKLSNSCGKGTWSRTVRIGYGARVAHLD